ncbi:MAG: hypothetical protein ABL971_08560 [Vicinamibacterales bacterium]
MLSSNRPSCMRRTVAVALPSMLTMLTPGVLEIGAPVQDQRP